MKTLVKALLFAFWLLGAGSGLFIQGTDSTRDAGVYRYTVVEGVDLSVQRHRIVLHIGSGPRGLALSAAAPRWVVALSDRSTAATTAAAMPASSENASACLAHSYSRKS